MKTHKEVAALLQTAQREQRCAIGDGGKLYTALRRRTKIGEVVSPYPNLFAATSYWKSLNVEQQSMHLIRALAKVHPTWTFAGLSAACVYQYEHSYSLHNGTVDIVSPKGANCGGASGLNRIYMARCSQYRCQGILVTSPARTLIDCASLPFDKALAIYDSALRLQHVTKLDVETLIVQTDCNETNVKGCYVTLIPYERTAASHGPMHVSGSLASPSLYSRLSLIIPPIPKCRIVLTFAGSSTTDASSWLNMTALPNTGTPVIQTALISWQNLSMNGSETPISKRKESPASSTCSMKTSPILND